MKLLLIIQVLTAAALIGAMLGIYAIACLLGALLGRLIGGQR